MERARVILSPDHHSGRPSAAYNRDCITVGWLIGASRNIRVFAMLEWMITAMTVALPRKVDLGKETALAVAAMELTSATEEEPDIVGTSD